MIIITFDNFLGMQQENEEHPFSPRQTQILHMSPVSDIAELIAESKSYQSSAKMIDYLRQMDGSGDKWQKVRRELMQVMVVNPQVMYISPNFLTAHRLTLVRDLFAEEREVEGAFFSGQNGYLLMAAVEGYFLQNLSGEQVSKVKQFFLKALKKEPSFWLLSHLQNMQNNICDQSTGYLPSYNQLQHRIEVDRIQFFFSFISSHLTLFPQNVDILSVLFRMMLCLREENEADRKLLQNMKDYYFEGRYHFQITMRNIKFSIQFFRNSFNQKEALYYPQKVLVGVLGKYSQEQVQNILEMCWLGVNWGRTAIHNYFTSCIKLGLTDSTLKMMLAMVKFCQKHNKFSELLYAFENNLSRLFIFLKYAKLYRVTEPLLKHFILSAGPQITLYEKFIEKAVPLAQNIDKQIFKQFMGIVQTVAFLFKETTSVTQLTQLIQTLVPEGERLPEEVMKQEIKKYSWKVNVKSKQVNAVVQRPGYRGLLNIGNSCYMNSFLQSLFMNREFSREILSISTLELEKERMKDPKNEGKNPSDLSKVFRQDLRPLAELQRLFALLLASKRTEINPTPIRNIAPKEFRNNYQHDSIEFGRMFLDLLYKNKIGKIFEGEMVTAIRCESCKGTRERKEAFLDLMVTPLKDEEEMDELMAAVFGNQTIEGLQCDHCGQKSGSSEKRHLISKLPNYLMVSIKRFQYSVADKKNHKIMSKINVRESLAVQEDRFDLYSIIIHRGPSPNAGHYFAFSKYSYQPEAKWICHNDSEVNELEGFKEVRQFMDNNQGDTPYILFYERREHVQLRKEELMKPVALRRPLEDYVNRDNAEEEKSREKKVLPLFNPFQLPFFRKDDDDEEGGPHNPSFYNNYIL